MASRARAPKQPLQQRATHRDGPCRLDRTGEESEGHWLARTSPAGKKGPRTLLCPGHNRNLVDGRQDGASFGVPESEISQQMEVIRDALVPDLE